MDWDDAAPSKDELASTSHHAWDAAPPSKEELGVREPSKPGSWLDTKIPGGTPRGYIQGALDTLPTVGMVGGAAAAGTAGFALPVPGGAAAGAVVGAGLGDAAGESLKNLGEKYILGQDKTRSDIYGKPAKGFVEGTENEMTGQSLGASGSMIAATKPVKYVAEKAGDFGKWFAKQVSNIPKSDLEQYLKDPAKVMSLYKEFGGDEAEMADKVRASINEKVQATKANLNSQISESLKNRAGESVDAKTIVEKLENSKKGINSKLYPEQIQEVDGLIKKVNAVTDDGKISLNDAHDLKQYLQKQAESTYEKDGQMFSRGEHSAKSAKGGAAEVRSLLNEAAPEIAGANSKLAELHDIDEVMNSNMLSKGKPSNSLYTAGSGEHATNAQALRRLDTEVGGGVMDEAKNLSAAKTFGNTGLTAMDHNGKSLTRAGIGATVGMAAGAVDGQDLEHVVLGGAAGAALTSPTAIKLMIDSGVGTKAIAAQLAKQAPSVMGKGAVGWMNNGFSKLFQHGSDEDRKALIDNQDALMKSKTGKNLLVSASSLTPGSKKMDAIMDKIKEEGK